MKPLPGLNEGTLHAAMVIVSPVRGFLPVLSPRSFASKVPKPTSWSLSPSAIIASYLGAPAWVVFACLKCDQILKCFVAVVKINRFNWMKNLTRDNRIEQKV